jgi:hypothetical protein
VTRLLRAVFSLDDPREAVHDILAALAARELSAAGTNAACLVIESAFSVYASPAFVARFGDEDVDLLAGEVLASLPSMGDAAAARLAWVLAEGNHLDATHRRRIDDLLRGRPLPAWAVGLFGSIVGKLEDGVDYAFAHLDSDDPRLGRSAMEFLVRTQGEGLLGLVGERLARAASPDERIRMIEAVARAGDPEVVLPFLRDALRTERLLTSEEIGVRYLRPLLEALRSAPAGLVRDELAREGDPAIRARLVGALGIPHEGLLVDCARGSAAPDLVVPALVSLSTFRSDPEIAGLVADRLVETRGEEADPRLFTAAANILRAAAGRGDDASDRIVGELRWWREDPDADPGVRRAALRALLPALDEIERRAVLEDELPEGRERMTR